MSETIAPPNISVEEDTVCCDGGNGLLGHPSVYLKIGPTGSTICPYCSRRFVKNLTQHHDV